MTEFQHIGETSESQAHDGKMLAAVSFIATLSVLYGADDSDMCSDPLGLVEAQAANWERDVGSGDLIARLRPLQGSAYLILYTGSAVTCG